MEVPQQPIPVTILTGFLGAGKTTLLNRILKADHGLRVAVLVNDFGSINIDAQLVIDVESETISLANGCICCTIRDDLLQTAFTLLDRPQPPEYLIIEASGVSDPWAIADTFLLPELRTYFRLDSVITVVDAEYVHRQPSYESLIVEQISAADIVVLNKIDLVPSDQLTELEAWVRRIVPQARILPAMYADVPLRLLLDVGRLQHRVPLPHLVVTAESDHHDHDHHDHDHHDHGSAFATWSYVADQPFTLHAFRRVILNLPPAIFRAKGLVYLAEVPQRRAVLQLVGSRVQVTVGEPWGNQPPQTQMVFIGLPGQLDETTLRQAFDRCLIEHGAGATESVALQQTWQRPSVSSANSNTDGDQS
ncbi:MAG: cobalamin biosynthesis protein CobW [Chloroflexus sp.]|uniref:CobW family GTP-binding protein n=1 Tax=Chloroflexus sp. TaxID=1904827 RepID=UPI0021DC526F|nr:GTP-binding protein [Chloroflexus sp.]GIV89312.1 MAG: cobalamin biosynthesis protein CobW [Chloroflexus sp.]